jgi:hypothetical protein
MTFEITADEFDALMKYHKEAIQHSIERQKYDEERYHEERMDELCRYADERRSTSCLPA